MNDRRTVVLELTRIEAAHLSGLVGQFAELLGDGGAAPGDPAIARLTPDAYADDAAAAQEFRDLTERDLLDRRRDDAGTVQRTLAPAASMPADVAPDDPALMETVELPLDADELAAWLRCLAALRLVLAERLGIRSEADASAHLEAEHDAEEDPRFGIYEWLGYRLEGLVHAASGDG